MLVPNEKVVSLFNPTTQTIRFGTNLALTSGGPNGGASRGGRPGSLRAVQGTPATPSDQIDNTIEQETGTDFLSKRYTQRRNKLG
jgi:hypothetical protein